MKIDGIEAADLIDRITRAALFHRSVATAYRPAVMAADTTYDLDRYSHHMRMMRHDIVPLADAIVARTVREREIAQKRADRGAVFLLAGADCLDCERPAWQHIFYWDESDRIVPLCPFGREYWALAREILGIVYGKSGHGRDIIASIARH